MQRMKGQGTPVPNGPKEQNYSSFQNYTNPMTSSMAAAASDPYMSSFYMTSTPYQTFGVGDGTWSNGGEHMQTFLGGYGNQVGFDSHSTIDGIFSGGNFGGFNAPAPSFNYGFHGNGDFSAWGGSDVRGGTKTYDDYYQRNVYQDDRVKTLDQGVQNLTIADPKTIQDLPKDANGCPIATNGAGGEKISGGSNSPNPGESASMGGLNQPKKGLSWASVASQPAKPQPSRRRDKATVSSIVPGRHMDIGTWEGKNGGPKPVAPPPAPRPAWEAPRGSRSTTSTAYSSPSPRTPPQSTPTQPPSPQVQNQPQQMVQPVQQSPQQIQQQAQQQQVVQQQQVQQQQPPPPPPQQQQPQLLQQQQQQQQAQHQQQQQQAQHQQQQQQQHQQQQQAQLPSQAQQQQGSPQQQQPPQQLVSQQHHSPTSSLLQGPIREVSVSPQTGSYGPPQVMGPQGINPNHPTLDDLQFRNEYNPKEFDLSPKNARFFVIKSYSEDDIHRSIKYEIWCSTDHGNKRLDAAFREREGKGPIFLFFSVNGSGHFCGVAQMMSFVDYNSSSKYWAQDKWKGQFGVKWIYVKDVPNNPLRHIRLENNENKPVTNSRDTQEVPYEKGKQVLKIIHNYRHATSIFDDFIHYEKRQEETEFRRCHQPSFKELEREDGRNDMKDPRGDPRGGDPRGGDPRGGDPRGGDPRGADPRGADPRGADPRGADPRGADPRGGDPRGGDPRGGDPRGGDPRGGGGGGEYRDHRDHHRDYHRDYHRGGPGGGRGRGGHNPHHYNHHRGGGRQ